MILVDSKTQESLPAPTAGSLLLCSATRWEAAPLAAGLRLARVRAGRWEGLLGERRVVLIQTGVGPVKAGEALDEISETFGLALSAGFAGALQPGMASGDIVCDIRGSDAALPPLARRIAADRGISIHFGKIAHSERVLCSPEQKRALGAKERASAVDMETQALRAWSDERGLPILPVRVVLDGLEDRLPRAVPAGEDALSLARYVLGNFADLPVMIATGFKQRRAIENLGRFLEALLPSL
ncbi:MAG: hypothetical protein HY077_07985 [Elusimicrobia bacterium]|nr:hypothetical protein [Elusimicrobiota bacterium]